MLTIEEINGRLEGLENELDDLNTEIDEGVEGKHWVSNSPYAEIEVDTIKLEEQAECVEEKIGWLTEMKALVVRFQHLEEMVEGRGELY